MGSPHRRPDGESKGQESTQRQADDIPWAVSPSKHNQTGTGPQQNPWKVQEKSTSGCIQLGSEPCNLRGLLFARRHTESPRHGQTWTERQCALGKGLVGAEMGTRGASLASRMAWLLERKREAAMENGSASGLCSASPGLLKRLQKVYLTALCKSGRVIQRAA